MEFFNSPVFLMIIGIILSLLIIALFFVIMVFFQIQSFIQYHKEYMVNSQVYISEARDVTYRTKDIIEAMRKQHFETFLKYHYEKKGGK